MFLKQLGWHLASSGCSALGLKTCLCRQGVGQLQSWEAVRGSGGDGQTYFWNAYNVPDTVMLRKCEFTYPLTTPVTIATH